MMLISGTTNGILAQGVITQANMVGTGPNLGLTFEGLIEKIKAGNAYVNVHTAQFGPGEIRGQIK